MAILRLRSGQALARWNVAELARLERWNDDLPETLEHAEWIGKHRTLERLRQKADALRETCLAD